MSHARAAKYAAGSRFPRIANLGDLDGDGVNDVAVTAVTDDGTGDEQGAMWVLFLKADRTVKSHQRIESGSAGFTGPLIDGDTFGRSLANIGDLDGDGVPDLAVGAFHDSDGGNHRGAVWILFMKTDGTVKGQQKISDTQGGFTGTLAAAAAFGVNVAALGEAGVLRAWIDRDPRSTAAPLIAGDDTATKAALEASP